ncbi:hypothetical protein EJ05DRAFT_38184 [Pseudovirgaria hyperparasitica]|uniref:Peroxin 26 n=1 Tax=Pseudovirgaria hyperparasitica TaxID=470096 RepID=A0A6A6WN05_9PEZI|nr:uncharacterized protein EJ05DRAFT_38184 [Pseudovirgaria hyperparasitica]KAF2763419.1 hypothetical protein EJ05DRAFT_38184 [Pseudovirgaria hyperparasitica]
MPAIDMSYDDSLATSRLLQSSISSLSSSRQQASQIAKAYRQAAQLFLTRRLPEAFSTIEPIITPEKFENGDSEEHGTVATPAPIAAASRGTRIKVWSFYLTFLNAVIELGPEEGKHAFGSVRWKGLAAKCRDGSVWDEVVRVGYGGSEGDVDAEVVINLATLLLTHSPSQKLNQQRLENYLSSTAQPTFDFSHMATLTPRRRNSAANAMTNGTNTPRDLNSKLKLLELYTLHILPRNDEWDYAREFIGMSELLDDERKEAFQIALHGLKEEREHAANREAELQRQQQEQLEQKRQEAEAEAEARRQEARKEEEERKKREGKAKHTLRDTDDSSDKTKRSATSNGRRQPPDPNPSRVSRPAARKPVAPPPSFYQRASAMMGSMQTAFYTSTQDLTNNPVALIRMMVFFLALALAFGRRDLRERLKRMIANAWDKIRRTIGMGVKVSYI